MAKVMRGDIPGTGSFCETQERLVICIGQTRRLPERELKAIGGLANGVEEVIYFLMS